MVQNNFGSEKNLGLTTFLGRKEFEFESLFGSNKISGQKTWGPNKIFGLEKILGSKKNWVEEVLSKNSLVHKNLDPQKIGFKKFDQNQNSNS